MFTVSRPPSAHFAWVRSALVSLRVRMPVRAARPLCALAALGLTVVILTGCDGSSKSGTTNTTGATGTTGTTGTAAAGKGTLSLTFSNAAGTNANTSAFTSSQATANLGLGAAGLNNFVVTGSSQAAGGLRAFLITLDTVGAAVVGQSYSANSQGSSLAGVVTLTQTALSASSTTPSVWSSSGGSIVVDSITGKNYKLRFVDVTMSAGEGNDSAATGNFTLNGTANVTLP